MSHHRFSTAIVSIRPDRAARRRPRARVSGVGRTRRGLPLVRRFLALILGAALSMALSGCGLFCGMAGGFGGLSGFGGNCGIGFPF
jgi:hypothetical protein